MSQSFEAPNTCEICWSNSDSLALPITKTDARFSCPKENCDSSLTFDEFFDGSCCQEPYGKLRQLQIELQLNIRKKKKCENLVKEAKENLKKCEDNLKAEVEESRIIEAEILMYENQILRVY